MEIRLALPEELDQIIEIEKICFPEAEAASPEELRKRFSAFPENFFVAAEGGKVIGFIEGCTTDAPELPDELYHDVTLHRPDGGYQTVFGLDVLPEYRRKGVASEIMKHMIEESQKRGKQGVVLTCKDYLIQFYESFGYEHRGRSASGHGGAQWNDMVLLLQK